MSNIFVLAEEASAFCSNMKKLYNFAIVMSRLKQIL